MNNFQDKVNFIFSIADVLRGPYKPNQYGKVVLPLTVLRRLDCVIGDGRDGKPNQITDLTRIYGDFKHDDKRTLVSDGKDEEVVVSKIFDNEDFGFRKITVDRPLRLRFEVSDESLDALREVTAFANLAKSRKKAKKAKEADEQAGKEHQDQIIDMLKALPSDKVWMDRKDFLSDLADAVKNAGIRMPAPIKKAIVSAHGKRDEKAEICRDGNGDPEPDSQLRDYENVPLKHVVTDYFDKEVKPYVPDAWINTSVVDEKDQQVGKVGYDIPINRHFYVYKPPRPLEDIEADIAVLEKEIVASLKEVVA